jgi:flagellar protein FlaI
MAFTLRRVVRRLLKAKRAGEPEESAEIQPSEIIETLPEPEELETIGSMEKISLPKVYKADIAKEEVLSKIRNISETYPLVTTVWQGTKYVIVTATIKYNPLTNQLTYTIEEPVLSDDLKEVISKTMKLLEEKLDIDPAKLKAKKEVYFYVDEKINEIWDYQNIKLSDEDELKAKYYILRDTIGYGPIEPLMRDPNIEDISCDGHGLPVFIFHRNPFYGGMQTNISFATKDEVDSFVMKLAQKSSKTISVATPLLDATLPDGSRLQATFGTDIARRGSNFSIRKFFRHPLTVVDLINYGTVNPLLLAYLWLAVEEQQSILIAGTTAVGKTTFLNSISQFIRPNSKVVSIEDTAELQLTNVNWVPQVARSGYGPKKYGEVTMFDLLRAALRQRPDVLIVGEVRGREASVMFQAMATGHAALSTLHADSVEAVIDRLTTRPISLPISLLQNLDMIIFLEKTKEESRLVRRVGQIVEIAGYDRKSNDLKTNTSFDWNSANDTFVTHDSILLAKIAKRLGWNAEQVNNELMRRASILKWMYEKHITRLRDVAHVINMYYADPRQLNQLMEKA